MTIILWSFFLSLFLSSIYFYFIHSFIHSFFVSFFLFSLSNFLFSFFFLSFFLFFLSFSFSFFLYFFLSFFLLFFYRTMLHIVWNSVIRASWVQSMVEIVSFRRFVAVCVRHLQERSLRQSKTCSTKIKSIYTDQNNN